MLTIRVKGLDGTETFFKIKDTTKMKTVFGAYAQKFGIQHSHLRFMFDGERVSENDTALILGLEMYNQLDCYQEK